MYILDRIFQNNEKCDLIKLFPLTPLWFLWTLLTKCQPFETQTVFFFFMFFPTNEKMFTKYILSCDTSACALVNLFSFCTGRNKVCHFYQMCYNYSLVLSLFDTLDSWADCSVCYQTFCCKGIVGVHLCCHILYVWICHNLWDLKCIL